MASTGVSMSHADDDKKEGELLICKIVNMEGFVEYVRKMSWQEFSLKVSKRFSDKKDIKKIELDTDDIGDDEDLPLAIIMSELRRFVFYGEDKEPFILKSNIHDIIKTLANHIIAKFLGRLVDQNILEMCWDPKFNEFIWRVKGKKEVTIKPKRASRKKKKD
jgi:hypothetical protein